MFQNSSRDFPSAFPFPLFPEGAPAPVFLFRCTGWQRQFPQAPPAVFPLWNSPRKAVFLPVSVPLPTHRRLPRHPESLFSSRYSLHNPPGAGTGHTPGFRNRSYLPGRPFLPHNHLFPFGIPYYIWYKTAHFPLWSHSPPSVPPQASSHLRLYPDMFPASGLPNNASAENILSDILPGPLHPHR